MFSCCARTCTTEGVELEDPLSSECGTYQIVKARFWPWISSLGTLFFLFARNVSLRSESETRLKSEILRPERCSRATPVPATRSAQHSFEAQKKQIALLPGIFVQGRWLIRARCVPANTFIGRSGGRREEVRWGENGRGEERRTNLIEWPIRARYAPWKAQS